MGYTGKDYKKNINYPGKYNGHYTPESTEKRLIEYQEKILKTEQAYISELLNKEDVYNRNCFFGLLHRIGKEVFRTKHTLPSNRKSVIDYSNIEELNGVLDLYIDLCTRYKQETLQQHFLIFSGITAITFFKWANGNDIPWIGTAYTKQDWLNFTKKVNFLSEMALSNSMLNGNVMAYAYLKCKYGWKEYGQQTETTSANIPRISKEEALSLTDNVRDRNTTAADSGVIDVD